MLYARPWYAGLFELDKYDRRLHLDEAASPAASYPQAPQISGMAFLHWAEHCVECAAPACYTTCDLYQARSDLRCRRFVFGAHRNRAFGSLRGYGVEISFKKWAKLETVAAADIRPVARVLRLERALLAAAPIGNALGRLLYRFTENRKWVELTYYAIGKLSMRRARRSPRVAPDALLLEVYNPNDEPLGLQVMFGSLPDKFASLPMMPPAIRTLTLPHGYSRHVLDVDLFRHLIGVPFRITLVPEADKDARLVFLTADLVTFAKAPAAALNARGDAGRAGSIKCVVFDLDGTLWDGTLVEDQNVKLKPQVPGLLASLDRRGILMSVASKNDFDLAWNKLREFGIADYFLYPQIDWLPKGGKIGSIAKRLNIGIDSLAFVDDNPFELDEVAHAAPQVARISADALEHLLSDPRLGGSTTAEARERRRMYQGQMSREKAMAGFDGNYFAFLASCAIVLEVGSYSEDVAERIQELVQRTNQLNFSGCKYTRAQLAEIIADPGLDKFVVACSDKYGSYGTVGFCVARNTARTLEIVDFMLSCRVQGKFIEQALFAHLLRDHSSADTDTVVVNFHQSDRNTPALNVLRSLGFRERGRDHGEGMILKLSSPMECKFVEVRCAVRAGNVIEQAQSDLPRRSSRFGV